MRADPTNCAALKAGCRNAPLRHAGYRSLARASAIGAYIDPVKPGAGEELHAAALDPGMR
jgi:hypothetical protein